MKKPVRIKAQAIFKVLRQKCIMGIVFPLIWDFQFKKRFSAVSMSLVINEAQLMFITNAITSLQRGVIGRSCGKSAWCLPCTSHILHVKGFVIYFVIIFKFMIWNIAWSLFELVAPLEHLHHALSVWQIQQLYVKLPFINFEMSTHLCPPSLQ